MKKKIIIVAAFIGIVAIGTINVNLTNSENNDLSGVTLANRNALTQEIDYHVPNKSNSPQGCTTDVYVAKGAEISPGNVAPHSDYYTVSGMENFCESGIDGCDPYNCHRRI